MLDRTRKGMDKEHRELVLEVADQAILVVICLAIFGVNMVSCLLR